MRRTWLSRRSRLDWLWSQAVTRLRHCLNLATILLFNARAARRIAILTRARLRFADQAGVPKNASFGFAIARSISACEPMRASLIATIRSPSSGARPSLAATPAPDQIDDEEHAPREISGH